MSTNSPTPSERDSGLDKGREQPRQHRICPWWLGYWLANPLRRLMQNPETILAAHIKPGMTVLEVGPGMGFWTVPMARLVGEGGKVVAVDVQKKMLEGLVRRAKKAGVTHRVDAVLCQSDRMSLERLAGGVDFVLAFAVVHEVPSAASLLAEIGGALRVGGRLLIAEPVGHVSERDFAETLAVAKSAGLELVARPMISRSRSALLEKRK